MDSDFETFSSLQVESVIESFRVQQHAKTIGFSNFSTFLDIPIVLSEDFEPIGDVVKIRIESQLRFDDATDSIVGSEIWVEIRSVSEPFFHPVAGLQQQ